MSSQTTSSPRVDAREKVTGKALYTEDLPLPYGTAYCAILGSPHSHARIRSINAAQAERVPGVAAVLTREHLEGMDPVLRVPGFGGGVPPHRSFIAVDKVRYHGEPVAAVAAESLAIARHALSLIQVEYEELPSVFDPRDATAPGAPILHEALGSNVVGEYRWDWGDVEQGFREADRVFEDTFYFPSIFHHPMENLGGCIAEVRGDQVELEAPIQHLFHAREEIADLLGLAPEQVRIRMPYIGGGFGAKELKMSHLIAIWMARKSRRPTCVIPTAEESIRNDARHPMVYRVRTGVKADGRLWAMDIELLVDEGAYTLGLGVTRLAVAGAWGAYRIPHMRMVGRSIFTNRVPAGAFRSLAKAQVTWGYETHYDTIARELGVDPMEFRIRNFMRRGDIVAKGTAPLDADYDVLLRKAAEAIGWDGRSSRVGPRPNQPPVGAKPLRGRGLSTTFRHGYVAGSNSFVTATIGREGKVKLLHTAAEIGMGVYSVMARVAAQTLGISESQIEVSHPDTENPYSDGIASSRDTVCMGMATQNACEDLKRQLVQAAVIAKGGSPDEWHVLEGRLWQGEQDYAFGEIVGAFPLFSGGVIIGTGSYLTPRRDNPFLGIVPFWEVSAGAAEVEVDPETGDVRLLKYATVCDVGKAVRPAACKGQLDGGAVMGLGNAMLEELVYRDGQLLNGDPMQYKLPVLGDVPQELHSVLIENGDGPGPQGSKGMGQTAVSPVAPAIGNAIYEAVGVRIKDLPITREKVLRALGKL